MANSYSSIEDQLKPSPPPGSLPLPSQRARGAFPGPTTTVALAVPGRGLGSTSHPQLSAAGKPVQISASPSPKRLPVVAPHTYSDRNSNQVRLERAPPGLPDKPALCRALRGQSGQTPGSAASPSPAAASPAFSLPPVPPGDLTIPPTVCSFHGHCDRFSSRRGQPILGLSWSDKIGTSGGFSSQWPCLGREAPFLICAKVRHGLTPPWLLSLLLARISPSPLPLQSSFRSPISLSSSRLCPTCPLLHCPPPLLPILVLLICLPAPAPSHLSVFPLTHGTAEVLEAPAGQSAWGGGRGESVGKNSSQVPQVIDVFPQTSYDCPNRAPGPDADPDWETQPVPLMLY